MIFLDKGNVHDQAVVKSNENLTGFATSDKNYLGQDLADVPQENELRFIIKVKKYEEKNAACF